MKKAMLLLLLCGAPLAVFSQNPLTLDDCFTFFRFYPEFGGDFKYAADSRYYWVASDGEIALYETATGVKNRVLLDKEALEGTGAIESFELNGDETSILLQTNVEHIYRHSVVADYWVYDLKRNKHFALNEGAKIQFAQFSPDGKQVVFILNNNIYVRNLESANTMRITDDGAI
ncbi:MAG: DPP IV N-terminal domain-containing protein, partial [Bacteroidetes bacterium]|nr:DPP IV N-terminal domain-containing protein [Bacteroidota bacterium]